TDTGDGVMCHCTPNIRTPFCGKPGCEWPKQKEKTMDSVMRCKMVVEQVTRDINPDGTTRQETVKLRAVYEGSPENKEWAKYTPSASFSVSIDNPGAHGKLS